MRTFTRLCGSVASRTRPNPPNPQPPQPPQPPRPHSPSPRHTRHAGGKEGLAGGDLRGPRSSQLAQCAVCSLQLAGPHHGVLHWRRGPVGSEDLPKVMAVVPGLRQVHCGVQQPAAAGKASLRHTRQMRHIFDRFGCEAYKEAFRKFDVDESAALGA